MNAATWIALWAAALSTVLAIIQILSWRNARPRLRLNCRTVELASAGEEDSRLGGVVLVDRGPDQVEVELQAVIDVRNVGEKPVQILAVCLEELQVDNSLVSVQQIEAPPIPAIVEPRTSISVTLQIEYLAIADNITFIGVVDALGNKHKVPYGELRSLVEACWHATTRAKLYRHREDPSTIVRAFPALQVARMSERPIGRWGTPRILIRKG